jgi:flagellar protein FlbD
MIRLTRLNGQPFVVNAELIRTVESLPDTTITLINGDHLIVRETMEEVVARSVEYGRSLRRLVPPDAPAEPEASRAGRQRAGNRNGSEDKPMPAARVQ